MSSDVFISYATGDLPWAERLESELKNRGLDVFRDRSRVQAGADWRATLTDELRDTKYLVVLWSKIAKEKPWVDHEVILFESRNPPASQAKGIEIRQHMIFILLDFENVVYNDLQQIRDFYDADVYSHGADQVDAHNPNLWPEVARKVYDSVRANQVFVPIPLLILATTQARLANLPKSSAAPPFAPLALGLNKFIVCVKTTREKLLLQYGPTNQDWKPFGSKQTIMTALEEVRDSINALPNALSIPFRWAPISERFWSTSDPDEIEAEIRKLRAPNLAVIVVDPISLYDGMVFDRFVRLQTCFTNEKAIIIVPSPFGMPLTSDTYRDALKKLATDIFWEFYEPGVRRTPNARWHVSFGDHLYIKRSLLNTICSHFRSAAVNAPNPILNL